VRLLLLLGGLAVLLGRPVLGQQADEGAPALPIVERVRFEGNDRFADSVLRAQVRTRANRRFFGIPGFTWWRWLHRIGASGALGSRLSRGFLSLGEPPARLDTSLVAADVERLQLYYQQEGFREAEVTAHIDTLRRADRVGVTFAIAPGPPTYVRRMAYEGLSGLSDVQQRRLARASLLPPERLDPAHPLRFRVRDQRFSEPLLVAERRRVLTFLREAGYAAVARDSVRAFVAPQSPDSFDVTFRVRPGPRYRFGDVHFQVTGPEEGTPSRGDTLTVEGGKGTVTWTATGESRLRSGLLRRALRFQPGTWYDQSAVRATKRRLEATGVFSFTDITPLHPDSLAPPDGAPRLPHRITLRTRERHQIRLETFMLQRSVVLAGSDSELGAGIGGTYSNANLLGGGETFTLRASGSLSANLDSTLFNAAQAEVSTSLALPYLVGPFRRLDRRLNLYQSRTRLSLSLLTARRDALGLIIRGRGGARIRLELQHTPSVASLVDVLDLNLSNPDTTSNFEENFLGTLARSGDSLSVTEQVQRAQILEDYTQPQINNALRYTLRSSTANPLRRERGHSYEAAVEVGGNLPYLLDRLVFSPDSVAGSIPGLPFFGGQQAKDALIYRQYLRAIVDLRRYRPLSRSTVFAWKAIGGIGHPVGRADVLPFDRRFYSGGATSVRGWRLRELGPGGASFGAGGDGTNFLGGDVKLEASVELRGTMLRNVLAANWVGVLFADVGNVWFGPRNPGFAQEGDEAPTGYFAADSFLGDLGVGSGLGLRLAWDYLIVRFDFAYRVFDPQHSGVLLPRGLNQPVIHFGIGHAF
jgi:outer membrane protein assembly factor BamA